MSGGFVSALGFTAISDSESDSDQECSADTAVTAEAAEAARLASYNAVIKKLSRKPTGKSVKALQELLNEELTDSGDKSNWQVDQCSTEMRKRIFTVLSDYYKSRSMPIVASDFALDALRLSPSDVSIWLQLYRCAVDLNDYVFGIECLKRVCKLRKGDIAALGKLVTTMCACGDVNAATDLLADALHTRPGWRHGWALAKYALKVGGGGILSEKFADITRKTPDVSEAEVEEVKLNVKAISERVFSREALADVGVTHSHYFEPRVKLGTPVTWQSFGETLVKAAKEIENHYEHSMADLFDAHLWQPSAGEHMNGMTGDGGDSQSSADESRRSSVDSGCEDLFQMSGSGVRRSTRQSATSAYMTPVDEDDLSSEDDLSRSPERNLYAKVTRFVIPELYHAMQEVSAGSAASYVGPAFPPFPPDYDVDANMAMSVEQFLVDSHGLSLLSLIEKFVTALSSLNLDYVLPTSLHRIYLQLATSWLRYTAIQWDGLPQARREAYTKVILTYIHVGYNYSLGMGSHDWFTPILPVWRSALFDLVFKHAHHRGTSAEFVILWLAGLYCQNQQSCGIAIGYLQRLLEKMQNSSFAGFTSETIPEGSVTAEVVRQKLVDLKLAEKAADVAELFDSQNYDSVVNVLTLTLESEFSRIYVGRSFSVDNEVELVLRKGLWLLVSCVRTDKVELAFHWLSLAVEYCAKCLDFGYLRGKKTKTHEIQDIMKDILGFGYSFCKDGSLVKKVLSGGKDQKRDLGRLGHGLTSIAVRSLSSSGGDESTMALGLFVPAWLSLYRLCAATEETMFSDTYFQRWYSSAMQSNYNFILGTRSLMLLVLGHHILRRKYICTLDNGRFLHEMSREVLRILRHPVIGPHISKNCSDDMLNALEQCFYCLYVFPSKRPRHIEEHSCRQVKLTWAHVGPLFECFKPEQIPEFDDTRNPPTGLSQEESQLFLQIEAVVPDELKPGIFVPVIRDYLAGRIPYLPPILSAKHTVTLELFHLLADFYLKNASYDLALRYYLRDLCFVPNRFDSWAGYALVSSKVLNDYLFERQLDYGMKTRTRLMKRARGPLRAFEQAVRLTPDHQTLWVEYGSFVYNLQSYLSRFVKRNLGKIPEDVLSAARDERVELTKRARHCFEQALSFGKQDRWFVLYMLGKIAEKLQDVSISTILKMYMQGLQWLHSEGCSLTKKIQYQGNQRYAFECMELYYRAHVAILKQLERITDRRTLKEIMPFSQVLRVCPFVTRRQADSATFGDLSLGLADQLSDMVSHVSGGFSMTDQEMVATLRRHCKEAMSCCARRYPCQYKATYWLARMEATRTPFYRPDMAAWSRAKRILLGSVPLGFDIPQGLFENRKQTNFFNSIWRIPIDDIDRPGSFAAQMFRSLRLLAKVQCDIRDLPGLLHIGQFLAKKVDLDKQYLLERDQVELAVLSFDEALKIVKDRSQKAKLATNRVKAMRDVAVGVFNGWQAVQRVTAKAGTAKNAGTCFSSLQQKSFVGQWKHTVLTVNKLNNPGHKPDSRLYQFEQALSFCENVYNDHQRLQRNIQRRQEAAEAERRRQAERTALEKTEREASAAVVAPSSHVPLDAEPPLKRSKYDVVTIAGTRDTLSTPGEPQVATVPGILKDPRLRREPAAPLPKPTDYSAHTTSTATTGSGPLKTGHIHIPKTGSSSFDVMSLMQNLQLPPAPKPKLASTTPPASPPPPTAAGSYRPRSAIPAASTMNIPANPLATIAAALRLPSVSGSAANPLPVATDASSLMSMFGSLLSRGSSGIQQAPVSTPQVLSIPQISQSDPRLAVHKVVQKQPVYSSTAAVGELRSEATHASSANPFGLDLGAGDVDMRQFVPKAPNPTPNPAVPVATSASASQPMPGQQATVSSRASNRLPRHIPRWSEMSASDSVFTPTTKSSSQ